MSQLSLPPYDACCLAPLIYIHTYVKLLCLSAMLFFTPVDDYVISSVDKKQWPLEISHPNVLKRFITAIIFMCYCEYQFILRPFKPLSHGQGKVCLQLWVSDFKDNFYTSWLHFSFLFFFCCCCFFHVHVITCRTQWLRWTYFSNIAGDVCNICCLHCVWHGFEWKKYWKLITKVLPLEVTEHLILFINLRW